MSPFLPPHRQYDFGPDHPSPLQCFEEADDCALCPSLLQASSPQPQYQQDIDDEEEREREILAAGRNKDACSSYAGDGRVPLAPIQADNKQTQAPSRSHSLRKRATVDQADRSIRSSSVNSTTTSSLSLKWQHKQVGSLPRILTTSSKKDPTNTFSLDRFSACIPCRKRKIKCIPKGDSHHYLSNGTNNGVCATCIRRKKDCFWPKIDVAARTSLASPSCPAPRQHEIEKADAAVVEEEDDKMETCKEEEEEAVREDRGFQTSLVDEAKEEALTSPIKEEEIDASPVKSLLPATFSESIFGVPMHGFGRAVSTPALSPTSSTPSSSSSSSPSPGSPRTDASFLSPTVSESFFFEDKMNCQSPPYLDDLHHALRSETLFSDVY